MRTIWKKLLVIGALGLVVMTTTLVTSSRTAAAPGPLHGIAVRIVGGNVGIAGKPTVDIGNTETNPLFIRDLDNPARMPFRIEERVDIPATSFRGNRNLSIAVPNGYRAVIDHISVQGEMPPGQTLVGAIIAPYLDGAAKSSFIGTSFFGLRACTESGHGAVRASRRVMRWIIAT